MILNTIKSGVVLDHIQAGGAMDIYKALNLDKLECQVAIIKNATSIKMGKKDILKICEPIDINLDVLGYLAPGVTVSFIEDSKVVKRKHIEPPETIKDVIRCTNPRCITSIEQELPNIFKLTDRENLVYRCIYCESTSKKKHGDIK